ncbi:MAG: hypothetical protein JO033_16515 [Acidobacteriaceae bacterium]|nr:hypothetical protein [Acidobacteriaceae bacterium]MBV9497745.1 hypothetical protein [Acidobacteriaceae bacterium]
MPDQSADGSRVTRYPSIGSGKIESRLGGRRTDAKAAPEEETPRQAEDSLRMADLDQAKPAVLNSLMSV